MIEAALAEARDELSALRTRQAELEALIAQGEAALGDDRASTQPGGDETLTLHEALAEVLRGNRNHPMTARELTDAVNRRGLYRKRDGTSVEVNQVQARINNYDTLFERDDAGIRLREEYSPALATPPSGTAIFRDDDTGFFGWLDAHPEGYFVNSHRNPTPTYLVLHLAICSHFDRSPSVSWTKDYAKICSTNRHDLETWADETVAGELTLCRTCFS